MHVNVGKPAPVAIVEGLPLYRCEPLSSLLSVAQCERNRIAAGTPPKQQESRFTESKSRALATDARLQAPEIAWLRWRRVQVCCDCPGVLTLRERELAAMEAR